MTRPPDRRRKNSLQNTKSPNMSPSCSPRMTHRQGSYKSMLGSSGSVHRMAGAGGLPLLPVHVGATTEGTPIAVNSNVVNNNLLTNESPSLSSLKSASPSSSAIGQQVWKSRLHALKNSFLGSPKFHRKKMQGCDWLNCTYDINC